MKAHYPIEFWDATLNNCQSSYKKWVHIHEAIQYDVQPKNDKSIYALSRQKKINNLSIKDQLLKYGYWLGKQFYPNCYIEENNSKIKFNGLIASISIKSNKKIKNAMVFLGYDTQKYIQLNLLNFNPKFGNFVGINGIGYYKSQNDSVLNIISCDESDYSIW
jgi:hypothetical protein